MTFIKISDPVLRTNFKHLNKKDPTTRIKALSHIAAHIKEISQEEVIKALPEWIATLKKLVLDNTRRVRELSFMYVITFSINELNLANHSNLLI